MNPSPPQLDLAWRLAGWTMLHYLWIGAVIALTGGALRLACRRAAPSMKYAASLATLAALAATPIAIAAWLALHSPATLADHAMTPSSTPIAEQTAPTFDQSIMDAAMAADPATDTAASVPQTNVKLDSVATAANPSPSPSLRGRGMSWFTPSLEGIVRALPWLWLIGAPLTFALLAAGLVGSRRLQRACQPIEAGPIHEALSRLRTAMRVTRRVAVALADGVAQPILVGIVRPTILLPASAVSGWSPEELEMVLLHELAHVRRWDNLVNLVQRVVESLLFFHPAVWLASRQVRRDREECCDAVVLGHAQQPEAYASLLVSIASSLRDRRLPPMAVASAMADRALAGRIRRILKLEDEPMWVSRKTLAALLLSVLAIVAATLFIPPAVLADDVPAAAIEPSTGVTADHAGAGAPASPLELPATKEIVSRVPEKVLGSPAACERIVNELARQGFKAVIPVVEGDPDAKVAMTITVPADFKARVVWEEGSEGPVCRVIDLAKPAPAEETAKAYGSVSGPPAPAALLNRAEPDNDAVFRKVYPIADIDTIRLQKWLAIVLSDNRIDMAWFDDDKSLVVQASKNSHTRISELLSEVARGE